MRIFILFMVVISVVTTAGGQGKSVGVYVDKQGVLRWEGSKQEAVFFGVNYTTPFAYGYRSHKVQGISLEQAIDQDVYHLARLGVDAFRVHVWDTEISDSLGNVLNNEHLRLFDYLVSKLKERNIKIFLTPIAFWGNGYPEKDERTPGFSRVYGKGPAVVNEAPIKAQENYVHQLVQHVNPYTKLSYNDDPDIIAAEINNEPHHSGPKDKVTEYINRLAASMRSAGWKKPVFYNISESPTYADAVAKANIDGISMQWYPTGLVANHTLKGNFLPYVDTYKIPFDTIPAYGNKARMVYEFDAGDVIQPVMYPAMARSFRKAGFQWATQFAYDPLATAYANTEYQTHYLNLAYTPAKAISLLIASRAFHTLPRLKDYGRYPADSVFGSFRVSYRQALSEMNSAEEFYYSGTTTSKPVKPVALQHVAGVGSSPVVVYTGDGAYFLDKLENGVWRLEVMPDAVPVSDPFAKASLSKEVRRVVWNEQSITVTLADLGADFAVQALNAGNSFAGGAQDGKISVRPGTYLLTRRGLAKHKWTGDSKTGVIRLNEFVAPQPVRSALYVFHEPAREVSAGQPLVIAAIIPGLAAADKVTVEVSSLSGMWQSLDMQRRDAYHYTATVPAAQVAAGVLQYRIIVKQDGTYTTFPGNRAGDPWAWDNYTKDTWQTFVASAGSALTLFDAAYDRDVFIYPNLWRPDEKQFIAGQRYNQLIFKLTAKELKAKDVVGFQYFIGDPLKARETGIKAYKNIVVRMQAVGADARVKVGLVDRNGVCFASYAEVGDTFRDVRIPLADLRQDKALLLPRAYPGFQPLWFETDGKYGFQLNDSEKLEIGVVGGEETRKNVGLAVESVWLE